MAARRLDTIVTEEMMLRSEGEDVIVQAFGQDDKRQVYIIVYQMRKHNIIQPTARTSAG